MSTYPWCSYCGSRACASESSHRAQRYLGYRADFWAGGRRGKRIRKVFSNKKDAESYEYVTLADVKRGTFLTKKSSLTFAELADKYYSEHCLINTRNPHLTTKYSLEIAKEHLGKRWPLKSLAQKSESFATR